MKLLWLQFVEFYLSIGFKFYYKKITACYLEKIPKDKAVLFLSNHQNALLDPLLITANSTRINHFLTRAQVFSNSFISQLLKSLQMIPVYRMRDGIQTIQKNKAIFSRCSLLLHEKQSIILFPEGSHSLKRTVRPLSKGFTRIIEETFQRYPSTEIAIIPVGVNYQSPTEFGDSMRVYFGKHINPALFYNKKVLDVSELKNAVLTEFKKQTTHLDSDEEYDLKLKKLNELYVDFTNPIAVNKCIKNNFQYEGNKVSSKSKLYEFLKLLIKLMYFLPYLIWKKLVFPKISKPEFVGTFLFILIITLAPLFLIFEVITTSIFFGNITGLIILVIGIILPLFALKTKR